MWPTIIVTVIIAVIFLAIVINSIKNKKMGKSSCSCGCGGCAFKESCHKNDKDTKLPPEK